MWYQQNKITHYAEWLLLSLICKWYFNAVVDLGGAQFSCYI